MRRERRYVGEVVIMPKKKADKEDLIKDTPLTSNEIDQLDKLEDEIKQEVSAVNVQADLNGIIDKIIKYCEVQSGINLHPYQKDFAEALVWSLITNAGEEITALFSRQSGKTETVAVILGGCMVILPTLAKAMPDMYEIGMFKDGLMVA